MRGRKAYVMALGAVGLASALTASAFIAPNRAAAATPVYVPHDAATIVAHVPQRDPREIAERAALAAAPDRVDLAVEIARTDIDRARSLQDPRYLGRAEATLRPWWNLPDPPPDVLLLRATIEQSLHDFATARKDLDKLIAERPDDAQAQLTRAVVATVRADYPAARQSCDAVARLAPPLVAATCRAPLDAIAGHADEAYRELSAAIDGGGDASLKGWALTTLAEIAIQRGDYGKAADHLRHVLALTPDDAYARTALADVLIDQSDPTDASALLAGYEANDNLLVRRSIAEHMAHGPEDASLAQMMRARIEAANERGSKVHMREHAMWELAVEGNVPRALSLAVANWNVQKELADARLLAHTAAAAGQPDAAAPVVAWAKQTGVHDAQLDHWLGALK